MSNSIIILASSRSNGKTYEAIQIITEGSIPIVDLNTLKISPYDYEHQNIDDDYLPLMRKVVEHDLIILATPVYWYSMTAQMKIFIDRLSDLLEVGKDIGRKLRGKRLFVIASFGTSMPIGFEDPFSQTCEYLGMKYEGCSYIYNGKDEELMKRNAKEIDKARAIFKRSQK